MIPPKPGTIGLAKIGGLLGTAITIGQALSGDPSGWTHAFVVVDESRVIQAMPGGAEYASLQSYLQPGQAVFLPGWPELEDWQREALPRVADHLIGTPYSWLDYVSLIAAALHIPAPLTRRRLQSSNRMICSQLADELMRRLGVQLFDDGRLPQDVTPGDLHIRWTEALSEAALEHGFPPVAREQP